MKNKHQWILNYLNKIPEEFKSINTLSCDFVNEYIEVFKPKFKYRRWGSHVCPDLAKNLKEMYELSLIKRKSYGICPVLSGFPKWIWVYYKT